MRVFRSRSNLMFGIIVLSIVLLSEFSVSANFENIRNINFATIFVAVVPIVFALYFFIDGLRTIKMTDKGIYSEICFVPVKEITWDNVNYAGIAKNKIKKNQYSKQIYVSKRELSDKEVENISKVVFDKDVIWFEYSLVAQNIIAKHLGMEEEK